ncbi:predicted protein [Botrytis cinerea T4]|uniref:Uncharacterized protein n=1 Tax=Botryotinia fuckeliana (strain T4) TaxID=999810 RepID=G2Y0V9_BOTF4|nr:predicted protein [Botrytis cinerea T4]
MTAKPYFGKDLGHGSTTSIYTIIRGETQDTRRETHMAFIHVDNIPFPYQRLEPIIFPKPRSLDV